MGGPGSPRPRILTRDPDNVAFRASRRLSFSPAMAKVTLWPTVQARLCQVLWPGRLLVLKC